MTVVRILADDLTGALDAAAPFVDAGESIPVRWSGDPCGFSGALAFDSETRHCDVGSAVAAVSRLAPMLARSEIAYKKIDSLLRGHPAAELAACVRRGGFASAIVAPAFPEQNRIMRDGVLLFRASADAVWEPTQIDLATDFRCLGVPARLVPRGVRPSGAGILLCDAENHDDLVALSSTPRAAPPVLWCGSAGLARALAGRTAHMTAPAARAVLAIVGSAHPASSRQVDVLSDLRPDAIEYVREGGSDRATVRALASRLEDAQDAVLVFRLRRLDAAEATSTMISLFTRIAVELAPPSTLLVTGGDTLVRLCTALDAEALNVEGELEPGVPCSRLVGGMWSGVSVVSKSGAFGDADALVRIITSVKGKPL